MQTLWEETRIILPRLRRLARSWGGDIIGVTEKGFKHESKSKHFSGAPFTSYDLGVNWRRKIVFFNKEERQYLHWGDVIHEMGHVFACSKEPNWSASQEYDFFGWEYLLMLQVRGDKKLWSESMANYMVSVPRLNGDKWAEWCELDEEMRNEVLIDRIGIAARNGLYRGGKVRALR